MNFINHLNPKCSRCPYKLGLIKTLVNPCQQCKANDYNMFEVFKQMVSDDKQHSHSDKNEKG